MPPLLALMYMNFCIICGHETTEKIPLGDHQIRRVCVQCGNIHYVERTLRHYFEDRKNNSFITHLETIGTRIDHTG